jgi:hypothetical protein
MESFIFSSNTTALVGTFSYNGGNEVIGVVPEPSAASLIVLGALSLFALRKIKNL